MNVLKVLMFFMVCFLGFLSCSKNISFAPVPSSLFPTVTFTPILSPNTLTNTVTPMFTSTHTATPTSTATLSSSTNTFTPTATQTTVFTTTPTNTSLTTSTPTSTASVSNGIEIDCGTCGVTVFVDGSVLTCVATGSDYRSALSSGTHTIFLITVGSGVTIGSYTTSTGYYASGGQCDGTGWSFSTTDTISASSPFMVSIGSGCPVSVYADGTMVNYGGSGYLTTLPGGSHNLFLVTQTGVTIGAGTYNYKYDVSASSTCDGSSWDFDD